MEDRIDMTLRRLSNKKLQAAYAEIDGYLSELEKMQQTAASLRRTMSSLGGDNENFAGIENYMSNAHGDVLAMLSYILEVQCRKMAQARLKDEREGRR